MRSTTKRIAAGLAAVLAFSGLTLVMAPTASAIGGQPFGSVVDIRVEHRLLSLPRVLEVKGVKPGAGPEVTVANQVENPASWGGNVNVDIDPDAQTITVSVATSACYSGVVVAIRTREIVDVAAANDSLWNDPVAARDVSISGGVVTLSWLQASPVTCLSLGNAGAFATFTYTPLPKPTMDKVGIAGANNAATRTVQWTSSPSSSRITGYKVIVKRGTTQILSTSVGATTKSLVLSSAVLSRVGAHSVSVQAVNEAGASAAVTRAFSVTAAVPGAPRSLGVYGSVSSSTRTVKWVAPSFNGRSTILSYRIIVKKGTKVVLTKVVGASVRSVALSRASLPAGSQTVSVSARNAIGTGAPATRAFTVVK